MGFTPFRSWMKAFRHPFGSDLPDEAGIDPAPSERPSDRGAMVAGVAGSSPTSPITTNRKIGTKTPTNPCTKVVAGRKKPAVFLKYRKSQLSS
jgi:hypothetical protein